MNDPDEILCAAEAVVGVLARHRVKAVVIGAGGYKSHGDIVELLARNPDADLQMIRAVCERYRLTGIDNLIAEAATIAPRKPNDSRNTI